MLAAAFGTGTKGVVGVEKALYPSTNTSAVYVLPFTRADDGGARRLIICSKLDREYMTRTAHSEALTVRGTGYDVFHLA